jgi:hypothetical protein
VGAEVKVTVPELVKSTVPLPARTAQAENGSRPVSPETVRQPLLRSASVAGCGSPASAMRLASSVMTACRSELCIRCHRAISGNVRPQPKQRLVLGSIIQTAMHGVSLLILKV